MSRVESEKVLKDALKDMPDSMLLVYKAGEQFKIHIIGGIEAHYMRDLLTAHLNITIQQQLRRDVQPLQVLPGGIDAD